MKELIEPYSIAQIKMDETSEKLKKSKGIYFIFIKNAIGGLGFSFK